MIADRCRYEMEFGRYKYPVFQVPANKSLNDILVEDATRGLEKRVWPSKGRRRRAFPRLKPPSTASGCTMSSK